MSEELKLADLVSLQVLEELQEQFEAATGVPLVFTDADGRPLTPVEDPLRFCASLVDIPGAQGLCLRRKKWDEPEREIEERLRQEGEVYGAVAHHCAGHFRDTAVPVVVEGQRIGFAVFSRTLVQEPDVERFRRLAIAHGMAAEVGEKVARHALVMPEEQVKAIASLVQSIANLVARAAYDTIKARKILELEELRDSLVHMIIHDLRTPLTSIMGSLQVLKETEYDEDLVKELVPMALSSSETMLEMVNTLLDVNKMESGKLELEIQDVRVGDVAHRAAEQVQGLAVEKNQELVVEVPDDCPALRADAELLRRLMVNLLGNAIKFTQEGGRIELRVLGTDEGLELSVADNGPGIPPEAQARIFEKFGQAQAHRERKKYSTGLGLTFCKMVAEAHGGRIWVESEVGKGTTFRVFLPFRPPAPVKQEAE